MDLYDVIISPTAKEQLRRYVDYIQYFIKREQLNRLFFMPGRDEGFGAPAMENIIVQELLTVLFLRGKDGKMEDQEKKLTADETEKREELPADKLDAVSGGYPVFRDFETVDKKKEK